MLNDHTANKFETQYKGPFVITHCFTNGTVNLQCVVIQIRYNICLTKTYKLNTKVQYLKSKICMMMSTYE